MLNLQWPMVSQLHAATLQHHDAAMYLLDGCPPEISSLRAAEVVYLGGYAVECVLKALLFSSERPRKHMALEKEVIQRIGHDLEKLRFRLEQLRKPLILPPLEFRFFRRVRRRWHSDIRYRGQPVAVEVAKEFMAAVQVVVDWVMRS